MIIFKMKVAITKVDAFRFKKLGDIGEKLALDLLVKAGFEDVCNLNKHRMNFPFADIFAIKNGIGYLFSVKTRNKLERNGKLNSRYTLGRNVYKHISELKHENDYKNIVPGWIAVSIEDTTVDAYWGTIEQLNGSRGINMSENAKSSYLKLAEHIPHKLDPREFSNKFR